MLLVACLNGVESPWDKMPYWRKTAWCCSRDTSRIHQSLWSGVEQVCECTCDPCLEWGEGCTKYYCEEFWRLHDCHVDFCSASTGETQESWEMSIMPYWTGFLFCVEEWSSAVLRRHRGCAVGISPPLPQSGATKGSGIPPSLPLPQVSYLACSSERESSDSREART